MSSSEEIVKKKRGRKKKSEEPDQQPDLELTSEKPKSRRGRKTKSVVSAYAVETGAAVHSDDENIIVKLNVKTHAKVEHNGISPNAYDAHVPFESTPEDLSADGSNKTELVVTPDSSSQQDVVSNGDELRVVELLKDFEMKSKAEEWPQNTSISCYWCCNQFTTVPFGIPVKYNHSKFHVYGCFCSLECAAAYNFDSSESPDEIWERYNLINLLSRKLEYKPRIKPAPHRLALKMFGGHLDIDAFRNNCNTSKILSVNFPPMMTMTQQIEEVNECDINSEYRYIPIDHDRINRYKEKLTLKRTKPLTDYKHTLDHMMNLKIN
jgi:hypothetical protein